MLCNKKEAEIKKKRAERNTNQKIGDFGNFLFIMKNQICRKESKPSLY